jgi:hypothetical protein
MSITVITVNGQSVNLVSIPQYPGMREVEFTASDAVATYVSAFTGQVQTQQWMGADMWSGTMTLPVLQQPDADAWLSFLLQLRGMANAFQFGDPLKTTPAGTGGTGIITTAGTPGDQTIQCSFAVGALLPGDYIQVGYRLYRVLDATGSGPIGIWPSLREATVVGQAITTNNPLGLFRLATNKRTWSADVVRLTHLSFQIQEYR